jgi:hypothetical protein
VALYPVYLIAIAAKHTYPQLNPSQTTNLNSELNSDRPQTPLLLRPFQKLIVWVEATDLYATDLVRDLQTSQLVDTENTSGSIASQANVLPEVGRQQVEQETIEQYEQPLDRIRQLIKAAIAYFFGKKPTTPQVDTVEVPAQPWLTMSDLFDDDSGPWPRIEPHESARAHEQLPINSDPSQFLPGYSDSSLVKSNRATASSIASKRKSKRMEIARNTGKKPGEIIPDLSGWLEDIPDFEPEEPYQPLRAWIETQATFLGYVYSPIMEFLHRLDRLIARFEQWLIQLWQKIWNKLRGNART